MIGAINRQLLESRNGKKNYSVVRMIRDPQILSFTFFLPVTHYIKTTAAAYPLLTIAIDSAGRLSACYLLFVYLHSCLSS